MALIISAQLPSNVTFDSFEQKLIENVSTPSLTGIPAELFFTLKCFGLPLDNKDLRDLFNNVTFEICYSKEIQFLSKNFV